MSTPITEASKHGPNDAPWGDWVYADKMSALEIAANVMREYIEDAPCWTAAAIGAKRRALADFTALQPKEPHE